MTDQEQVTPEPSKPFPEITERERNIAALMCIGQTGHEIAEFLRISVKTYDTHRRHLLKKLGVRNAVELLRYALARGYVAAPTMTS